MSRSERITRVSRADLDSLEDKTDWEKFDSPAGLGDPNDPDDFTEEDWANAVIVHPQPKVAVSIRLDSDVLEFFKKDGKGYQTRMNAVLRTYMEAKRR